MIIFGGIRVNTPASSSLFILHINNLTWTEGSDVGVANGRIDHVCATNGDSFIVWGGKYTTPPRKSTVCQLLVNSGMLLLQAN